jgi:hypothetical protein
MEPVNKVKILPLHIRKYSNCAKNGLEISMDLHILRSLEYEKVVFGICTCACMGTFLLPE